MIESEFTKSWEMLVMIWPKPFTGANSSATISCAHQYDYNDCIVNHSAWQVKEWQSERDSVVPPNHITTFVFSSFFYKSTSWSPFKFTWHLIITIFSSQYRGIGKVITSLPGAQVFVLNKQIHTTSQLQNSTLGWWIKHRQQAIVGVHSSL